ncbi:glutathione S-transferase [Actibacterium pelagium]|uniref:Glutathione S-transferase n=1 Tax=Actibacterium pelagium TaxID=2029103 RepID=A0A917AHW9_9RHOB|nr:glutathione S-transferase [Actibacterium pelagium]GGE51907.1 glutathione S-transferase [Actibacterium pelagium]
MQLFYAVTSPFVRKVMVVLAETGQTSDVEILPVYGTPVDPGDLPLDKNPLGKLPTLLLEDGRAIYDSRVITRYLDERAGAGLYPQAPKLWDSLTLEATGDGILDSALLMVYEDRLRDPQHRSADIIEGYWGKIERALALLSQQWMTHLNGPLDIGQIAAGCALGYIDFRLPDRDWRPDNPKLADWYETFSRRDSMLSSVPS